VKVKIFDDYHLLGDDNHSHRRGNLKSYNVKIFVYMSAYKIGCCRLVLLLNLKIFNDALSTAKRNIVNGEWIRICG
jgi:hypothetical protein